ncbi:hypothetical protein D3C87_1208200 [compost metagenome]
MMLRIGKNASSTRFTRAARTPSGKAMDTEISTATETSAMVCMDATHSPENRQNANINPANRATFLLAKNNANTTTPPIRA